MGLAGCLSEYGDLRTSELATERAGCNRMMSIFYDNWMHGEIYGANAVANWNATDDRKLTESPHGARS